MQVVTALVNFILSGQGIAVFVLGFCGACALSAVGVASPRAPLYSFAAAVICFLGSYLLRTYVGVGGGFAL